jgi:hypothetical protein
MVSFVSYVLQFKDDDSAIGDVARDMMLDTGIKRSWGYKSLVKHLESMNAVSQVYDVLEGAYERFLVLSA